MLLTPGKACCLISGLTIAAFFLGLILGYNNVSIFSSETVQEETGSELQKLLGLKRFNTHAVGRIRQFLLIVLNCQNRVAVTCEFALSLVTTIC